MKYFFSSSTPVHSYIRATFIKSVKEKQDIEAEKFKGLYIKGVVKFGGLIKLYT